MTNRRWGSAVALAALMLASGLTSCIASPPDVVAESPSVSSESPQASADAFSYEGVDGRTALELLDIATSGNYEATGTGENAFVTAVNGVTADESKRQFWALYVDGTLAQVGAGSLMTHDGEVIEWRLETY